MQRLSYSRLFLALLTAVLLVTSLGSSVALADSHEEANDVEEPFGWWMEPRYELGWRLYDRHSHTYPDEYLYPDDWAVGFDACESPLTADGQPVAYRWSIEGVENSFAADIGPTQNCRLDSESQPTAPRLPEQGEYTVALTIEFTDRAPETSEQVIEIRDLLIVSIGDSNAAGEGNPHVNQVGGVRPVDGIWFEGRCHRSALSGHARAAATIEANDPHTSVTYISFACTGAEIWTGLLSHYSGVGSGPPLKPQAISVMEQLCLSTWNDPSCIDNPREIDSMFLSVGVNDIGFASVLLSCAAEKKLGDITVKDVWLPGSIDLALGMNWDDIKDNPLDVFLGYLDEIGFEIADLVASLFGEDFFSCQGELDPVMEQNFSTLWNHYDLLGEVLNGNANAVATTLQNNEVAFGWMSSGLRNRFVSYYGDLPSEMSESIVPRDVYITSYPGDPFRDENLNFGGCGFLGGINTGDAEWITEQGLRLNTHVKLEAEKHRWHLVDGIVEGFEGHGYCSDDSYYVALGGSLLDQGDYRGVLHPNRQGHAVTRDRLLDVYYSEKPDFSVKHGLTITPEAVRILEDQESNSGTTTFTAKIHDRWYRHPHMIDQIDMPLGEWFDLPQSEFRYQADLADDEVITVLANATVGGGLFYPPKCHTPECAQVRPSIELRTERHYSVANNWGADYDWCIEQPKPNFYTDERVCTVEITEGGATMKFRYRIAVVYLPAAPFVGDHPGNGEICGEQCIVGSDESDGEIRTPTQRVAPKN